MSKILLGRNKFGYIVNYVLAPYFRRKLFDSRKPECVSVAPKFTSCFDKSFNRISNRKQLDVILIYFNNVELLVKWSYIGSYFMGTATAAETLDSFKEVQCDFRLRPQHNSNFSAWTQCQLEYGHHKEQDLDAPCYCQRWDVVAFMFFMVPIK